MKSIVYILILLSILGFDSVRALEFREQLKGLLPSQIEKFYHQIDKNDLILIDHAFMMHPENFYAQVKLLMQFGSQKTAIGKEFTTSSQKLAKQYTNAFSELYRKTEGFDKQMRFFYFWRVIHVLNDLLIYKTTDANLNKFAADVLTEWNILDVVDREHFKSVFPEIVQRIEDPKFEEFASIGRKLWSFERFMLPKD